MTWTSIRKDSYRVKLVTSFPEQGSHRGRVNLEFAGKFSVSGHNDVGFRGHLQNGGVIAGANRIVNREKIFLLCRAVRTRITDHQPPGPLTRGEPAALC